MTISQRIIAIMAEKGISKADLAKKTGINPRTISDWEHKETNPQADRIADISACLGVTSDYLLTGSEKAITNTISGYVQGSAFVNGENKGNLIVHNGTEYHISAEAAEMMKLYEGLDFSGKVKLLQTAIELSKSNTSNGSDK